MRGLVLSLAAAALLRAHDDVVIPRREDELKAKEPPRRRPEPPPEPRPKHGKVYPGGSVPGGARRAVEREMRAQDECFFCEGSGWQCSAHPTRGGPVFDRCEGCGNPRGNPSP